MPGRTYVSGTPTREGYTGHELDAETGLNYAGARYYMPALGRWTSVDPLADLYPGYSPYNYALNNPLSLTDPTGTCPEDGSAGPNQFGPGRCLAEVVVTARHPDRPTLGEAIGRGFTATLPVAGIVSQADSPIPGPADAFAVLVQIVGTGVVAHDIYSNWQRPPNVVLPPPLVPATGARRLTADEIARRAGISRNKAHELVQEIKDGFTGNPDIVIWPNGDLGLRDKVTGDESPIGENLSDYTDD